MRRKAMNVRALLVVSLVAIVTLPASAALTLLTGPSGASHVNNLVTNGSFENGAPSPAGSKYYWATGSSYTPFSVPSGWQSAGTPNTYATWGNDGPGTPHTQFSDNLPDGANSVYFGNADTTVNQPPTWNADGTVSFPAAPTFSPVYGGPCQLWQTVSTNTSPAPSYLLSFWASGEAALTSAFNTDGIFGLKVTNVLPGDPIQYLTAPGGNGLVGKSIRYDYSFVPLNPLLPVTVEFTNWGHLNLNANQYATELVIDDVIVNPVPEPATLTMLAVVGLAVFTRRRLSSKPMM
jgi:hypothetical protein